MQKNKHSLGWHAVKNLSRKNKIQRAIILILVLLWILNAVCGLTGGK